MKVSIIIPTYMNFVYLKFCIDSIIKNSKFDHEIIVHINGEDNLTEDFLLKKKLLYTKSKENIGLCSGVNLASKKSTRNYILYSHDDMFFCKNWDIYLENEVRKYSNNLYYLTGTNVSVKDGLINYDCGSSPKNFDELKFDNFCRNDISKDLQGSHWAPHLIHKELWSKIGGFSEEFNPGDGSDPDLCMKLWKEDVRIFKTISKFKVYHFSSVTTRKSNITLNNGTKTFLLKYGFNPRFFRKYYLRGNGSIFFNGKLSNPSFTINMFLDYIINRIKFFYYKLIE
jgi:GT2 family glycosyltransferase